MLSRVTFVTALFVCAACGPDDAHVAGARVGLRAPEVPSCFRQQFATFTVSSVPASTSFGGLSSGSTSGNASLGSFGGNGALTIPGRAPEGGSFNPQLHLFRTAELQSLMLAAELGVLPILNDPGARAWRWQSDDGLVTVEAESIARSNEAGALSVRVWTTDAKAWAFDVDYTPYATFYDFGDELIVATDRYLALGEWERGCHDGDISFERQVGAPMTSCWHKNGRPIQSVFCEGLALFNQPR